MKMKKIIALVLCALLAFSCAGICFAAEPPADADSFGAYESVFIVGVDGAGRFFKDADTPNFDRIFEDGAVVSGVSYIRHGLTNDIADEYERSSDTKYPTVFTYARNAFPDEELASFVHWNPINFGMIENDIGVNKVHVGDDAALTDAICDYFNAGNTPKLFYCHFDSVDDIGHDYGSASEEYITQIETVDGYIGRVYDAIEANGLMENGLFIVVSDHGHMRVGGHFGLTARETNTTLAVKGKTVVSGSEMDCDTRNRDVSAIVLYALGIERPDYMSSRVPDGVFSDVSGDKRNIGCDIFDFILSSFSWIITVCTKWI